MKKRVLAVVVAMVCMLASVMSVSAAKSPIADVTVSEPQKGYYVIRSEAEGFVDNNGQVIAVKDEIVEFNAGEIKVEELVDNTAVLNALKDKTALTEIFDLHDVNGGDLDDDGYHRVTLYVNTLTDKCKDVKVLHYNVDDNEWEILDKSIVNIPNKTVTVVSKSLSPIAIFATVEAGEGTGETLPPMGTTSTTWMMFAGAAIVVLGASVIATKKRSL